jgi:hypothetical protein
MRTLSVWILLAAALTPAVAQAAFDDLSVSPRSRAMGGAVVAVDGDAWSFYNNPALIPFLDASHVAAATTQPNGADFNRLSTVGGSLRLSDTWGGMAVGLRHYGVDYRDTDLLGEYTLSLSHGFRVFKDASSGAAFGWTLNLYNLDFAPSVGLSGTGADGVDPGNAWTVGLDLGGVVEIYERTKVGFSVKNLNNPTIGEDQEELTQVMAVGAAYQPYEDVVTAFDIRGRVGGEFRFHGGAEFTLLEVLALRAGLETDPNKVTGGFGVLLRDFSFDYGFSTGGGVLESTHHFGLSYRFGAGEE